MATEPQPNSTSINCDRLAAVLNRASVRVCGSTVNFGLTHVLVMNAPKRSAVTVTAMLAMPGDQPMQLALDFAHTRIYEDGTYAFGKHLYAYLRAHYPDLLLPAPADASAQVLRTVYARVLAIAAAIAKATPDQEQSLDAPVPRTLSESARAELGRLVQVNRLVG